MSQQVSIKKQKLKNTARLSALINMSFVVSVHINLESCDGGKIGYKHNLCFNGLHNIWALIIHLMTEPNYSGSSTAMEAVSTFFFLRHDKKLITQHVQKDLLFKHIQKHYGLLIAH